MTTLKIIDVEPNPNPEDLPCGGLYFRYVSETWIGVVESDINFRHRFRFLKSKSCQNEGCPTCEFLWDQASESCFDKHQHYGIDGISSERNVDGHIYQLKVIGTSVDYETGYVDDIDIGFVKADDR